MQLGILRGNHTSVSFKSCDQAMLWLNEASHDDLYPLEMAFRGDKHLHRECYEHDIDWKNRCLEFFGPKVAFKATQNIQDYLIP